MSTIGELIYEKKNNFCNYLLSIIEDEEVIAKVTKDQIELYKSNIGKLRSATIEIFIFWVSKELCAKKDKLDEYPAHFLKLNGIEYIQEIDKYKSKIISYLNLFIDIIDYTFNEEEK